MANSNYEVRAQLGGAQVTLWRGLGTADGVGVTARQVFGIAGELMQTNAKVFALEAPHGKVAEVASSPAEWSEVVLQGPDGMFERVVKEKHAAPAQR